MTTVTASASAFADLVVEATWDHWGPARPLHVPPATGHVARPGTPHQPLRAVVDDLYTLYAEVTVARVDIDLRGDRAVSAYPLAMAERRLGQVVTACGAIAPAPQRAPFRKADLW